MPFFDHLDLFRISGFVLRIFFCLMVCSSFLSRSVGPGRPPACGTARRRRILFPAPGTEPGPHHPLHELRILDLAGVAPQGLDLQVQGGGDVDPGVRLGRGEEKHLRNPVWRQALGQVAGIEVSVLGRGVGGVEDRLAHHAVVRMEDVLVVESPVGRIVGEEGAGAVLADHPDQFSPEFEGVLKLPVRLAEEDYFFGPHHRGRRPLLLFPLQGQGMVGDGGVIGSLVPLVHRQ